MGHSKHTAFCPALLSSCVKCGAPCRRAPSSQSSEDRLPTGDFPGLENKRITTLDPGRLARRTDPRPKDVLFFAGDRSSGDCPLIFSPQTKSEHVVESNDDDDEYFSARSCLSHCSSSGEGFTLQGHPSVLQEFRHCKGWPFGLCRRSPPPLAPHPPLPSPPSESWAWKNRSLAGNSI